METLEAIRTRRSMREFSGKKVSKEIIEEILEAGRWAPSGMNNQPWRFVVVSDKKTNELLSEQTHYDDILKFAPCAIAVFYDMDSGYERTKDVLAIGACIQNMLLAARSLDLASCWLGEILKNKEKVALLLEAPASYELMAVIALGESNEKPDKGDRKEMDELIYKWT
ncbi:MAG: nitroreductase [Candidatus Altiarchaeia archaeon]